MNRTRGIKSLASVLSMGALAAICLAGAPAVAQEEEVPAEVIATLVPVYHEGHAAYWYHNAWRYRDAHGGWTHYREEPAFLRDHRTQHPAEYHHYGRR